MRLDDDCCRIRKRAFASGFPKTERTCAVIVVRVPLRIPLGGGGTDLPSYYSQRGGALVAAGINKYIYVTVNRRFEPSIRVSYSRTEIKDTIDEIEHPIVREALRSQGVHRQIEITTVAEVPANTGMGSSSAFAVALLLALHTYKGEYISRECLAEEAYHIEREVLGEPVGKQDHYMAAFGGLTTLDIDRSGAVRVDSLQLDHQALDDLESGFLLFYTGIKRNASDVLTHQDRNATEKPDQVLPRLDRIKEIGDQIRAAVKEGNIRRIGELMQVHWEAKKTLSKSISTSDIDRWCELARANGCIGSKLLGAGGGGFMLFCSDGNKPRLRAALAAEGLVELRFHIDWDGAKVVANV